MSSRRSAVASIHSHARGPRIGIGLLCLWALAVCAAAAKPAIAQSACKQLSDITGQPIDCTPGSSGSGGAESGSDEPRSDPWQVWRERWERVRERQRRRAEQKEAERKTKAEAEAAAKKRAQEEADALLRQEVAGQQQKMDAQLAQEREAERMRLAAAESRRQQAAFDAARSGAVASLKGLDGAPGASGASGLKGVDEPRRPADSKAWASAITDPKIEPMARRLAGVVPPPPMPPDEVALDWKKVYLNDNRLMNTADVVIAAWEITGVLGKSISLPCKALLIGGKSFIAGEDGAYMYLVKKDGDYDAALAYLKDPARAPKFARLVQQIRQNRPVASDADPAMVQAARTVTDAGAASTAAVVWDAMTSKEALGAMLRKAAIEVGVEVLSPSTGGLLADQAERKVLFDAVRQERNLARKMLQDAATTEAQKKQLATVIRQADRVSSELYKVGRINEVASGVADYKISNAVSDMSEAVAEHILGPEAKGREY